MAAVLQLLVEVFFYQTIECVWVHYAIPRLVSQDVKYSISELRRSVDTAFSRKRDAMGVLDTPDHLFVSTQVAKQFPTLFECSIVLAYHSVYPGRIAEKWKGKPNKYDVLGEVAATGVNSMSFTARINATALYIHRAAKRITITATVFSAMQYLGTFPMRLQKVIIHTLQPLLLAVLCVVIYFLIQEPIAAAFIAATVILYLVGHLWMKHRATLQGKVTPIHSIGDQNSSDDDSDQDDYNKSLSQCSSDTMAPLGATTSFGQDGERGRIIHNLRMSMASSSSSSCSSDSSSSQGDFGDEDTSEEEEEMPVGKTSPLFAGNEIWQGGASGSTVDEEKRGDACAVDPVGGDQDSRARPLPMRASHLYVSDYWNEDDGLNSLFKGNVSAAVGCPDVETRPVQLLTTSSIDKPLLPPSMSDEWCRGEENFLPGVTSPEATDHIYLQDLGDDSTVNGTVMSE